MLFHLSILMRKKETNAYILLSFLRSHHTIFLCSTLKLQMFYSMAGYQLTQRSVFIDGISHKLKHF